MSTTNENADKAVIVVTPYSTGCCMALEMQEKGFQIICLWSKGFSAHMKTHVPDSCKGKLSYAAEVTQAGSLKGTADLMRDIAESNKWNLVACVCGGEAGVDLADALSEELGLITNGTHIPNRRDKKVQQELIGEAGLRSVRQGGGTKFSEAEPFLKTERYPLIVKPLDSAGSDGVMLCHTFEEAKAHFNSIIGKEMINGGLCEFVLCQEFLIGREYVVDMVSRDGVHKVVMTWLYDKRPANGSAFVYFGDIPVDPGSPESLQLIPYARKVLDAIGVRNGPSHGEIIMTEEGPCLVEMNCRSHGGDGNWRPLCQAMTGGYDQVSASVLAYLDEPAFNALPDVPPSPLLACGQCVDLVSFSHGIVKATPGYDIIRSLPSFVCLETHIKPGSQVHRTVDISTDCGSLVVLNDDEEVLMRDIAIIRQMEKNNGLFSYHVEESDDDMEWIRRRNQMLVKTYSLDFVPKVPKEKFMHRRMFSHDLNADLPDEQAMTAEGN